LQTFLTADIAVVLTSNQIAENTPEKNCSKLAHIFLLFTSFRISVYRLSKRKTSKQNYRKSCRIGKHNHSPSHRSNSVGNSYWKVLKHRRLLDSSKTVLWFLVLWWVIGSDEYLLKYLTIKPLLYSFTRWAKSPKNKSEGVRFC